MMSGEIRPVKWYAKYCALTIKLLLMWKSGRIGAYDDQLSGILFLFRIFYQGNRTVYL